MPKINNIISKKHYYFIYKLKLIFSDNSTKFMYNIVYSNIPNNNYLDIYLACNKIKHYAAYLYTPFMRCNLFFSIFGYNKEFHHVYSHSSLCPLKLSVKGKKSINTDFVLPSLYNHKSFVQG